MKAGFIGLGSMGMPMAKHLAEAGFLKTFWNRTESVALGLAQELGLKHAATPESLAAEVDVVLICVSADEDLLAVIDSLLSSLKPGSIVIDHSTVSVATAQKASERVRSKGADFLDAPVSGGVEGAKNARLAIMLGGSIESLEKVRPILECMSSRIVHMGDVGSGQATKAVNQIMCAGINQAVTEALAFGAAENLDLNKVIEVVSSGAAGNWFLEKRGPTMIQDSFKPGFKLALHHKDLKICLKMAESLGISLPVSEMTLHGYEQLMQQGHGDEDISALYRLKRPV